MKKLSPIRICAVAPFRAGARDGLASGTYVVVFFGRDQRLGQQVIIKE